MIGNGWLHQFLPIKYELKTLPSIEMACDLGIQKEIQAVCWGLTKKTQARVRGCMIMDKCGYFSNSCQKYFTETSVSPLLYKTAFQLLQLWSLFCLTL